MENWLFLELQDIEEKEEQRKAERRRRQIPGKCVGQGGEGKRDGGWHTWNEGEINLAGSGLSDVAVIAGGEMMIALTWDCSLWAAKARSLAHMHAQT